MAKSKISKVGIDVGYANTKIVTGEKGDRVDSFKSIVKEWSIDIDDKKNTVIEYEGKRFTVGSNYGRQIFDSEKMHDINFELCLMSALARTHDIETGEFDVVTGLPILYYQAQKDALADSLKNKQFEFKYNGQDRRFTIHNVAVFPQSAGIPLLYPKEFEGKKVIVVDIGGFTVDVSYFEDGQLVSYNSYDKGVLMFYKKLATAINEKYSLRYTFQDMERVIEKGLIVNEKQIEKKEFDLDDQQRQWVTSIMDDIKADFPWNEVDSRTWIGGGALAFKDFLPETKNIKTDEVYANAKAFFSVGVNLFG